ncbi:CBS domain-containing protein [Candidatus Nomurabacteria bacterium]|nr:CBS domain-containing protein [Candidatus Kaiserbacteria bacterium]MCB9814174.1 CBS domain-containing protein [Candidatus Nomurabacteria bacterium]
MKVKDIVKPAVIVAETDTFEQSLKAMITQQTNTLLVVDEDGLLSGEVTVADLLDAIIPDTLNGNEVMEHFSTDEAFAASIEIVRDIPVSEFMSMDYSALELSDNLLAIIATAISNQRARIPVVDKDQRPVGIVSRQGLKQILAKFLVGKK